MTSPLKSGEAPRAELLAPEVEEVADLSPRSPRNFDQACRLAGPQRVVALPVVDVGAVDAVWRAIPDPRGYDDDAASREHLDAERRSAAPSRGRSAGPATGRACLAPADSAEWRNTRRCRSVLRPARRRDASPQAPIARRRCMLRGPPGHARRDPKRPRDLTYADNGMYGALHGPSSDDGRRVQRRRRCRAGGGRSSICSPPVSSP